MFTIRSSSGGRSDFSGDHRFKVERRSANCQSIEKELPVCEGTVAARGAFLAADVGAGIWVLEEHPPYNSLL